MQPRDVAICEDAGELGWVDTTTIHRRHWRAGTTIRAPQKRLKKLVEHGLLMKVSLLVSDGSRKGGSIPTIYGLTPHGADVVEEVTGQRPRRVAYSTPHPFTLRHRLEMVEVRIALDEACRHQGLPQPTWIMEQDVKADVPRDAPPWKRMLLYETFNTAAVRITCRPDASCHISIPRDERTENVTVENLIAYFELDRSTESLKQIRRKLPGWTAFLEDRRYMRHWPQVSNPNVRVFFVCPSEERITNIIGAVKELPVANYFRFVKRSDLDPKQLLTDRIWRDAQSRRLRIIGERKIRQTVE